MEHSFTFKDLLKHTWANSSFYRDLYQKAGIQECDLPAVKLQDLPIVTKSMMIDHFDEVVTDPRLHKEDLVHLVLTDLDPKNKYLDEFYVIKTSGQEVGMVMTVYDSAAWRKMASIVAPYIWPLQSGMLKKYKNVFFYAGIGRTASATIARYASPSLVEPVILSMAQPMEEILSRLTVIQPDRLTSYSSTISRLAELTLEGKLPISPRDVLISGDPLTPTSEARIKKAWNAEIYDLFATTESLFIALKQPGQKEWHVFNELNTLEVLSPENQPVAEGEAGRLILTNLYNFTFPLIRYELDDFVFCGESKAGVITTLRGFGHRVSESLSVMGDDHQVKLIPPYELIEKQIPGMEAIQFIPYRPDYFEISYCSSQNLDATIEEVYKEFLASKGCSQTHFSVNHVDHIWNEAVTCKLKLVQKPEEKTIPLLVSDTYINPLNESRVHPENSFTLFPKEAVEGSIPASFERQVASRPNAIAIRQDSDSLTFQQLNSKANHLANLLQESGIGPYQPVVLFFNPSPAMAVAMLATLKAGSYYVPLDPTHPQARNDAILEEVQAKVLLTNSDALISLKGYALEDIQVINLDDLQTSEEVPNPGLSISPETPACILFTSGSTGKPKGVLLDHRAILHRVYLYTNDYHISAEDHLSLIQLYVYNASVREIFGALLNGAQLCLFDLKRKGIQNLAGWLEEERITVFYATPPTFRVFLETNKTESFEHIRLVRLGGELPQVKDVQGFQQHFQPDCLLANALAMTETGTTCQIFLKKQTQIPEDLVPVGYPTEDKTIRLLDEEGNPVKDGETGEMVVESTYLGPGYYSPDQINRLRLAPSSLPVNRIFHTGDMGFRRPDGCIYLVGRRDWMVKIRGQRVNLTEIEAALLNLENIAEAAVVYRVQADFPSALVAYLRLKGQSFPDEKAIRQALKLTLPGFMIPGYFVFLDTFPKTANGKIDRLGLPALDLKQFTAKTSISLALATPLEETLIEIWKDILRREQIGLNESFFDLGGDSLQAVLMVVQIEEKFEQKLPFSTLYQYDTIQKLEGLLASGDFEPSEEPLVLLQRLGEKSPIYLIPGIGGDIISLHDLVGNMGIDHPIYGLQWMAYDQSPQNVKSIEQIARDHLDLIRASQPRGPYFLVGYSYGGHITLEIGRQLMALGEANPGIVLVDTLPPGQLTNTSFFNRMVIHLDNLRKMKDFQSIFKYLTERQWRLYLRLLRNQKAGAIERLGAPVKDQLSAAGIALVKYHPQPYAGDVVLFQSTQRDWYVKWNPMEKWRTYIQGTLEIKDITGNHESLIRNPAARELAHQLNLLLDRPDNPSS